ncbi:MAG: type II toxin-antitoxin system HicA family toxin [Sphingomonadales bacterium]|nr:MAG: type II toxin-antitoxin system HicA family toxin [Sphingomonadales bacterium]
MDSREIIRQLQLAGWRLRATKGSHHHFTHPDKPGRVTVPHPRKDVKIATQRSIERQAGMTFEGK